MHRMHWMNEGGMYGGMFLFGLIAILIILFLLVIGFYLIKRQINNNSVGNSGSRSIEILKERLAKGEISEDEYDRLRKKLDELP